LLGGADAGVDGGGEPVTDRPAQAATIMARTTRAAERMGVDMAAGRDFAGWFHWTTY
jgi:hypothetical protein